MSQQEKQRLINLNGTYNFRDMGGYLAERGKKTKWGVLYRADELCRLSEGDLEILKIFKIKTIIDFRSHEEFISAPDKKPETVKSVFNLPVEVGSMLSLINEIEISGETFMMQIYDYLIEKALPVYKVVMVRYAADLRIRSVEQMIRRTSGG